MMTKRCFLALKVPAFTQFKDRLLKIENDLDIRLKIVTPSLYHFTLHFFGNIDDMGIDRISTSLNSISVEPFTIDLSETGIIPSNRPRKARVLFMNPKKGADQLMKLQSMVQDRIRHAGFQVKKRSYLPHLTVARVKGGRDIEKLASIWLEQDDLQSEEFEMDKVTLVHSTLTPEGPIYRDLFSFS